MIDQKRLADTFTDLVRIDSVSKQEAGVAAYLRDRMESLDAETVVDSSAGKTGSNTGNLIARFSGNRPVAPMILCAHMDTVEPGRGIRPVFSQGIFSSAGETILGADDKSGVAVLMEVARLLHEQRLAHGPVEFLFTTCEETGLSGAKHLDTDLLKGRFGYALDTRDTDGIITRAPAADRFTIRVIGKEAHAGAKPEDGINAIGLASKAIARLDLGRIDAETTCNIGVIRGGTVKNVVPGKVVVDGEARSHSEEKLDALTRKMIQAFEDVIETAAVSSPFEGLPRMDLQLERNYHALWIPDDHQVVRLAMGAAANLGRRLSIKRSGGGSDANVLFGKGIVLGILGTGMKDVHSSRETIAIEDMVKTVELVLNIIAVHGANRP